MLMIPVVVGIIGVGIHDFSNHGNKIATLTKENIEALTQDTELPEVVITCSSGHDGRCFIQGDRMAMCGEYMYYPCKYCGYQEFSCYNPPCNNRILF